MTTAIGSHKRVKLLPNRPLDFIYDPVFTVSNAKDYYNTVSESMKHATEFVMRPNFSSMFSEIQHYPNSEVILKSAYPIPNFIDASFKGKSRSMAKTKQPVRIEVDGADRFRYFRNPCDLGKEMVTKKPTLQYKLLLTDFVDPGSSALLVDRKTEGGDQLLGEATPKSPLSSTRNVGVRGVQTMYRESEAQTVPWTPPYVFHGAVTPEILTLANLSWGEGLPAGIHEVELIERARIKRQWEQVLTNSLKTAKDIETREKCIMDMETNEWLFREQEIEKINSYRMEMANKSMGGQKKSQFNRLDERVRRQITRREQQKTQQLKNLQEKKEREMRKLTAKHKTWESNLKSSHGTKESVDNLFSVKEPSEDNKKPLTFSTDHEVIKYDKMMFGTVEGLILMENAPSDPAPAFDFIKASKPKVYGGMCHKLCRWSTDEDLKQLQKDLRKMSGAIGHKTHTLTKKEKVKPLLPPLLCIEIPNKQNVELYKATSFIQQLLRGRAVQYKVFEDRKRLQPLIEELKKTRSLYTEENQKISEKRYEALAHMRKQFVYNQLAGARDHTVNSLNGEVTAALLDFLAKELQRLEAERQVHAFAMLAERERWQREAVEAGRRQRDDRRRQQRDHMFKQVMNIRNESVDIFLEDMLAKSINWLADNEARDYVRKVAHKVDKAAQQAHVRKDAIEQEEMVTDLIHNYIMPDARKALTRHKLRETQKKYLEIADNFIQNELSLKNHHLNVTQCLDESTCDDQTVSDESANSVQEDAQSSISITDEEFSKMLISQVFKTHCLPHSKSEEAYYKLKAQNEVYTARRAQLFKMAEVVKEDFLDVLIGKAEEMVNQVVHEKDENFVLNLGKPEFESEFETNKQLKMAKLMVLSDVLNDEFLENLICLAEEGKKETGEEERDEKRMEEEDDESEEERDEKRIEMEKRTEEGESGEESKEESFHEVQEINEEKQFFGTESFGSDNFFLDSD